MKFTTIAAVLLPLLPAILAAPSPNREPFSLSDLIDNVADGAEAALDDLDLGDVADKVKSVAEESWDFEYDGCTVVQCAAKLGPTTLTCATGLLDANPMPCLSGVSYHLI
jgi:hypothetical protein